MFAYIVGSFEEFAMIMALRLKNKKNDSKILKKGK